VIDVHRVRRADVEAWARLRVGLMLSERLVDEAGGSAVLQPAIERWLVERLDSPSFGAFVAEIDGRVVGSGGISLYDTPPGPGPTAREAYIMSMYTDREHRGRGVAGAILTALLDFARAAGGIGQVWLRATDMGRPLYLRAGFEARDSYLRLRLDG
jgi:GNAT superfamily N-acetyltransferase